MQGGIAREDCRGNCREGLQGRIAGGIAVEVAGRDFRWGVEVKKSRGRGFHG